MKDDEPNNLRDLWSALEASAESPQELAIALPRQPVPRRATLREKLVGATLNGYVPAFFAVAVGGLMATAHNTLVRPETSLFVTGLYIALVLVLLPMILLMRGLWSAQVASPGRYLALMLLTTGLTYQASSVTFAGFASRYLLPLDFPGLVTLAQDQYQAFLTPVPLLAAALAAFAAWRGMLRTRRGLPWVEMRAARRANLWLAWMLLLSPWFGLLGCALVCGHLAPQDAYQRLHQPVGDSPASQGWRDLNQLLNGERYLDGKAATILSWSPEKVRQVAATTLRVLGEMSSNEDESWRFNNVIGSLLERSQDLVDPMDFSWRLLEGNARNQNLTLGGQEVTGIFQKVVYPELCQAPYNSKELRQHLLRIEQIEAVLPTPKSELNEKFLRALKPALRSNYRTKEGPRPLQIMGWEAPFSPERALAEYQTRIAMAYWQATLDQLDFSSQRAMDRTLKRAEADLADTSIRTRREGAATLPKSVEEARYHHTGLLLRERLDGARLLLNLRLYKEAHGSYPNTLEQLGMALPAENSDYSSDGKVARVKLPIVPPHRAGQANWEDKWELR